MSARKIKARVVETDTWALGERTGATWPAYGKRKGVPRV